METISVGLDDLSGALVAVADVSLRLSCPGEFQDVAHICWQCLDLGPAVNDLAAISHRLCLMRDAREGVSWWGTFSLRPLVLRSFATGRPQQSVRLVRR
jgi:hypothetical protein